MKKKKIINLVAFILLSVCMFAVLSDSMKATEVTANANMNGFLCEPRNSIDVVVIGASDVYTSYAPTVAWEKEGFTSFDLATPGMPGNMYLPALREAIDRQNPSVVAMEINGFILGEKRFSNEGIMRNVLDNLPMNRNRLQAIQDEVPEDEKLYYYFPFMKYHSGWSSPKDFLRNMLVKNGIRIQHSVLKGVSTFTSVDRTETDKSTVDIELSERGKEALIDVLELCKQKGVKNVLFFRAPHKTPVSDDTGLRELFNIVETYGYDTLDCSDGILISPVGNDYTIDPLNDYYNREHLNYYGMNKFTAYFAEYMNETYDLSNCEHSEKTLQQWEKASKKADRLFEMCEKDMEENRYCHYYEYSVYVTPKNLHDKKK